MSKFATKAAANMFCQARYEAAKSNERLSSREGAAEEIGIDRTRLARIELGSTIPYQEEVLLMADCYKAPELKGNYCREMCPLGVKGTYTKAELQKNFAIPTVIFSPDFSDPQVRQAMLTQGMNSVNNMFGTPQIAVKNVDFESESTVFTQDDLDNPAYASDTESEDDYPPMQEPDIAPEPESEPEPDRSMDFQCSRYDHKIG